MMVTGFGFVDASTENTECALAALRNQTRTLPKLDDRDHVLGN